MDETEKTPANENVWNLLATAYGSDHKKNQRIWNSWSCKNCTPDEIASLSKSLKCNIGDFRPWSEDEVQHIKGVIKAAKGDGAEIPNPDDIIDFSGLVFENDANFSRFIFSNIVKFTKTEFRQSAVFGRCIFTKNAIFDHAKFERGANFINTCFREQAHFMHAHIIGSGNFSGAEIKGLANFNGVIFEGGVNFNASQFEATTFFTDTVFHQEAHFIEAKFGFEKKDRGEICFVGVKFLDRAYFDEAIFYQNSGFIRCDFTHPTRFYKTKFAHRYPEFGSTFFHQNTVFSEGNEFWPTKAHLDDNNVNVANVKETCSKIRHLLASNGLSSAAHFFFRREMAAERKNSVFWVRLPYCFYGAFSNYGQSISKPLFWLVVLWAIGAAAFAGYFSSCCPVAPLQDILDPIWTGIGTSFSNVFPLFGLRGSFMNNEIAVELPMCLKYISAAQTVFSLPLIFLLGLGLRNRFRLR